MQLNYELKLNRVSVSHYQTNNRFLFLLLPLLHSSSSLLDRQRCVCGVLRLQRRKTASNTGRLTQRWERRHPSSSEPGQRWVHSGSASSKLGARGEWNAWNYWGAERLQTCSSATLPPAKCVSFRHSVMMTMMMHAIFPKQLINGIRHKGLALHF